MMEKEVVKKKKKDNFSTGLGESLRSGYAMTNES